MANVELSAVRDLSDYKLHVAAESIAKMVCNSAVSGLLNKRHFWVASRNFRNEDSARTTLQRARQNMQSNGSGYYVLTLSSEASETGIIGFGTRIPKIPLRKMRAMLPPYRIIRMIPGMVTGEPSVADEFANISAWTDPRQGGAYNNLQTAYQRLREANQDIGTWTIEPTRSPFAVIAAIGNAGLAAIDFGRFDDGDLNKVLPVSGLYTAAPIGS